MSHQPPKKYEQAKNYSLLDVVVQNDTLIRIGKFYAKKDESNHFSEVMNLDFLRTFCSHIGLKRGAGGKDALIQSIVTASKNHQHQAVLADKRAREGQEQSSSALIENDDHDHDHDCNAEDDEDDDSVNDLMKRMGLISPLNDNQGKNEMNRIPPHHAGSNAFEEKHHRSNVLEGEYLKLKLEEFQYRKQKEKEEFHCKREHRKRELDIKSQELIISLTKQINDIRDRIQDLKRLQGGGKATTQHTAGKSKAFLAELEDELFMMLTYFYTERGKLMISLK